jgi:hypothetical protein
MARPENNHTPSDRYGSAIDDCRARRPNRAPHPAAMATSSDRDLLKRRAIQPAHA